MSGAGSRSTPRPAAVRCIVSTDRSTDASWRALATSPELDDRDDAVDDAERRQPAADLDVRHPGGEAGGDHVLDRARHAGQPRRRDARAAPAGGSGPGGSPTPGPAPARSVPWRVPSRTSASNWVSAARSRSRSAASSTSSGGRTGADGERGGPLPLAPLEGQPGIVAPHGELETGGDELGDVEGDVGAELGPAELGGELAELVDGGGARGEGVVVAAGGRELARPQEVEPAAGGESEIGADDGVEVAGGGAPTRRARRRARPRRAEPPHTPAPDRQPGRLDHRVDAGHVVVVGEPRAQTGLDVQRRRCRPPAGFALLGGEERRRLAAGACRPVVVASRAGRPGRRASRSPRGRRRRPARAARKRLARRERPPPRSARRRAAPRRDRGTPPHR